MLRAARPVKSGFLILLPVLDGKMTAKLVPPMPLPPIALVVLELTTSCFRLTTRAHVSLLLVCETNLLII